MHSAFCPGSNPGGDIQRDSYTLLQRVLLKQGEPGWVLGVATQGKAHALAFRLGKDANLTRHKHTGVLLHSSELSDKVMCLEWFQEVQQQARGEADAAAGRALCVLEYSILFDDWLAIWVLSGAGELLGSAKVPTAAYRLDTVGRFVFDDGLTRRNPQSGAHRLKGKIRGTCIRGSAMRPPPSPVLFRQRRKGHGHVGGFDKV